MTGWVACSDFGGDSWRKWPSAWVIPGLAGSFASLRMAAERGTRGPEDGGLGEAFGGDPSGFAVAIDGVDAAGVGEALVEGGPVAGFRAVVEEGEGERDEREEEVVELVLVAEVGPALGANGGDGGGVELAGVVGDARRERAAQGDGAGAAFFGASLVEEGVGHGVDELVRELRGDGRVDGQAADGAGLDAAEDLVEAVDVHGFGQGVAHDLADERVVGDLDVADDGLEAGGGLGEDVGEEVVGAGALDLRSDALAFLHAEELEGAAGGPAPAVLEDGRGDGGLLEELAGGVFGEELEDVGEREAVLLGERDVDAVVGGGGLELEVEAAAEAFAEGEAPGLVDAAAEGSVEDELLAAALVEEALGDDGGFGGHGAEDGAAGDDVADELHGSGGAEAALFLEPTGAGGDLGVGGREGLGGDGWGAGGDLLAEVADAGGEDGGALRGFALPEGDGGRGAVGVFDEDLAGGLDALDAPGGVAEEDDVAGGGVDGEVLVEGGDLDAIGLQDDGEERGVGDGAAV